jgi:chemotaxis protein histidine kinase CheA
MRIGKIDLTGEHVDLLCKACDFFKEALEKVKENLSDQNMESKASVLAEELKNSQQISKNSTSQPSDEQEKTNTPNSNNDSEISLNLDLDPVSLENEEAIKRFATELET